MSPAALRLLRYLAAEGDDEDGYPRELLNDGNKWVAGVNRVPGRVVTELFYWCCIKQDSVSEGYWSINETGHEMIKDPEGTCRKLTKLLRS